MSEEHEPRRLFAKSEGAFQFGTGERKTYVTRFKERPWGRCRVHWGPPEVTIRECRGERGFGIVERRATPAWPLHVVSPSCRLRPTRRRATSPVFHPALRIQRQRRSVARRTYGRCAARYRTAWA